MTKKLEELFNLPSQDQDLEEEEYTSSSVIKNVPTRGNSTKSSITSLKPGSTSAPGKGVHVKHGSYHRRLLNIKNISMIFKST